jgi:DNA repair protein RecN (Recombination protein N)
LEQANFLENEIENIDAEIKILGHAEHIKSILSDIYFQMEESEEPLVPQLKSIGNKLQTLQNIYPEIEKLSGRLNSLQIEMQDISNEIDHINGKVSFDDEKINELNARMALGYGLLKKHNVQTTSQLLEIKKQLSVDLEKVTNLTEAISEKEKQSLIYFQDATKFAKTISEKRKKEIAPFEDKVNKLLHQVGMPNAKIKLDISDAGSLNFFGNNTIEFLFNANLSAIQTSKSAKFEPLRKVASGGELSRVMLSIKSLVARSVQLPTLIFDEIDSGISGEAARQVGIIIKELSAAHQVISITHQPQIAAKAERHFFVYKEVKNDTIITAIKTLNEEERITAIATMLSGKKPTAAAFENAKELIGN